jgi:hypothetical protein
MTNTNDALGKFVDANSVSRNIAKCALFIVKLLRLLSNNKAKTKTKTPKRIVSLFSS